MKVLSSIILAVLVAALLALAFMGCNTEKRFVKYHDKQRLKAFKGQKDKAKGYCNVWYPFEVLPPIRDTTVQYLTIAGDSVEVLRYVNCDTVHDTARLVTVRIKYRQGDTVEKVSVITVNTPYVDSVALLDCRAVCGLKDKQIARYNGELIMWRWFVLIALIFGFIIGYIAKRK
jgi:hypothetical protein